MSRSAAHCGVVRAAAEQRPVAVRKGNQVVLVVPGQDQAEVAHCSSAAEARALVRMFDLIQVGDTPVARFRAAGLYTEAARVAARIRLHRRAS